MPVIDGSIGGSLSLQPSPQGTNSIPVSDVFSWLQLLTGLFAALMERSSAHTQNNIQPTAHAESSQRSRHSIDAHTAFWCHWGPFQFVKGSLEHPIGDPSPISERYWRHPFIAISAHAEQIPAPDGFIYEASSILNFGLRIPVSDGVI